MNKAAKKYRSEKCPQCGRVFLLGFTGTADGCDKCAGVVRDAKGYAWGRGEKAMSTTKGTLQRKAVFGKRR